MSEIDWAKAPEGATHYCPGNSRFYEKVGDSYFVSGQQNYGPVNSPESWVKKLVARPSPAWSGEGLPPVGVRCEAAIPHTSGPDNERNFIWIEGCVIAYYEIKGKTYAWFAEDDGFYPPNTLEFRPIRTPEQIAADEREAAIKEMLEDAGRPDTAKTRDQAQMLYDAGWRKVERAQ